MICPYCHNDVATISDKSLFRCAECKVELHRDFVQKTDVPYISVGLIGDINHGKTAFLTALFYLLNHMPSLWPRFFFNALDEYSHGLLYEKVAEFEKRGVLQGNTGDNFSSPALFKFTNIPIIGDCFISFNDVSGETYKSQTKISGRGRSVAQSDIAIFIVSISDWASQWEFELQKMLDTYVNAAQYRMQINLKQQDLIVTLTKGDLLSSKLSDELVGYLNEGAIDKYEKVSSSAKIGSNDLIRSIFTKQAGGFVNMAEKHFKSVNYTIVSSTGAIAAGVNSIAPIVVSDPKRVLDPFMHLMHCVKSERQRFLKKRAVKVPVVDTNIKGESHKSEVGKSYLIPPMVKFAGGAAILLMIVIYFAFFAGKSNSSSIVAPAPATVAAQRQAAIPPAKLAQPAIPPQAESTPSELFENGKELFDRDPLQAVQLFTKSAKLGHAKAQRRLGALYYEGKGVSQDYTESARWYRKAAENGDVEAQYFYGLMLGKGIGIAKDTTAGSAWIKKSADNGYADAKQLAQKMGIN